MTNSSARRKTQGGRTETAKLTGMKVKMQNRADGRWFWPLVLGDRRL
jgi:hypothetical protein